MSTNIPKHVTVAEALIWLCQFVTIGFAMARKDNCVTDELSNSHVTGCQGSIFKTTLTTIVTNTRFHYRDRHYLMPGIIWNLFLLIVLASVYKWICIFGYTPIYLYPFPSVSILFYFL